VVEAPDSVDEVPYSKYTCTLKVIPGITVVPLMHPFKVAEFVVTLLAALVVVAGNVCCTNVPVTVVGLVMVRVQPDRGAPAQAPPQLSNTQFAMAGNPGWKSTPLPPNHEELQLPASCCSLFELIVPVPVELTVTGYFIRSKEAWTVVFAATVSEQLAVPVHPPPLQPSN
jgi:hypothetical protein